MIKKMLYITNNLSCTTFFFVILYKYKVSRYGEIEFILGCGSIHNTKERHDTMKTTGIVRKLDELGRITLPIELRRTLGVSDKDALEISVEDDKIILNKYEPACIFTGEKEDLVEFCGKKISKKSIIELAKSAGLTAADL